MNIDLVFFKNGDRKDIRLAPRPVIIGRKEDADFRIPRKEISREHCELFESGGKLVVKDLGSSNGTYVNDRRIAESELKAGDVLRVASLAFVVVIDGRPAKIDPSTISTPGGGVAGTAAGAAAAASTADMLPDMSDEADFMELSEGDFDLDDAMSALDEDERDMP